MAETLDKTVKKLEQHIEALESRNAFQDDVIEQLNKEITIHQAELAEMRLQISMIATRLKESQENLPGKQEIEPPPPHY